MKPSTFFNQSIKTNNFASVILFSGSEDYWKNIHIKTIRKQLFGDNYSLNYFSYSAPYDSVSTVLSEINELSFFSVKKLVVYSEVDRLNSDDQKKIISYMENPNLDSYLILNMDKLDARTPLGKCKILKKEHILYEIDKKSNDISLFIDYKLKELGNLSMDNDLRIFLIKSFPVNLRLLANNLDKMAAFNGYNSVLSLNDIKVINTFEPEANHFGFVDAIVERNREKVLKLKDNILSKKDNVFMLIGLLRWQFQALIRGMQLKINNENNDVICSACKVPPFKRNFFLNNLQKYSEKEIGRKYKMIADADFALKSSSVSDTHIFEMLLYDLSS